MSAYICDGAHITAIAAAAVELNLCSNDVSYAERELGTFGLPVLVETARRIGEMLHRENVISVNYRYREDGEVPFEFSRKTAEALIHPYANRLRGSKLPALKLLRAIDCYAYQACEHPGWTQSPSFALCQELRKELVKLLPGYWEVSLDWDT